ncbi:MAG: ABC transporter substrate-binding protein [Peptostreptococcaceae bacterium]|nr:ABC transporter substrate-binding protein [Peptostreptococcaceae bacterium]
MKFTKKLMLALLVGVVTLTGCANGKKSSSEKTDKKVKIGISQIAVHSALDDVRNSFKDELKSQGVDADFIEENAQGDITNANLIAQKFVQENVDLILAIGTPSAQSAKTATSDIPIIFSAVTDPVKAELVNVKRFDNINGKTNDKTVQVDDKNISGTTDATPIKKQLELFKTIDNNIKTVGIVYNTAEINSVIQVEQATAIAKELGIQILAKGITNINEMSQAVDSLVGKVQGIYTITDNLIANAIKTVAEKANEHKIITVGSEKAHVDGGILVTDGISYKELGKQSAKMAKQVLDGVDISTLKVENATTTKQVINENTANLFGVDVELFKDAEKVKTK